MENLKSGTDAGNLANSTGGVTNASGQVIISSDSDGGSSYMFGPGFSRAVYGYVANGAFGDAPQDPASIISDTDNPLPYFDLESSGTGITVQAIADATAASGNVLRFSIASGTAVGTYLYIKRKIAVLGSAARSYTYQPRSAWRGASASTTQVQARIVAQYYQSDNTTASGTAFTNTTTLTTIAGAAYAYEIQANPNVTGAVPSNAAFLEVKTGVYVATLTTAAYTVDLTEVRVDSGPIQLVITDQAQPDNYGYGVVYLNNGTLFIKANETGTSGTNPYMYFNAATGQIVMNPTSTGRLQVNTTASFAGDVSLTGTVLTTNVSAESTTTSDLLMQATGADFIFQDMNAADGTNPRILLRDRTGTYYAGIKSGAAGVVQILSGSTTTTYGQLWAGRIYPMNGATASRYIYDDGTWTHFTGGIVTDGSLYGDSLFNSAIVTTTATTNSAIWVLIGSTQYGLRRNTSSIRYKTDVVDADEAVLVAARKIKPRHFTSTIPDEAGATRLGFIAEEVEATGLTHAVGYDAEGRVDTLDPTALIAALFARVNDLEARIEALEAK